MRVRFARWTLELRRESRDPRVVAYEGKVVAEHVPIDPLSSAARYRRDFPCDDELWAEICRRAAPLFL